MKLSYTYKEILETAGIIIALIIVSVLIPLIVGFGLGGFEEVFTGKALTISDYFINNIFYFIILTVSIIFFLVIKFREIIIYGDENPITSNKNVLFANIIGHDERDSLLWNLGEYFRKRGYTKKNIFQFLMNPLRLIMIFLVLGIIIGMLGAVTNTFLSKFPSVQQQFTETGKIISVAEPSAGSENIFFIWILLAIPFNLILWGVKKLRLPRWAYWLFLILFIPAGGLLWAGFHRIVYGALEEKLLSTFIFGSVGTFLTILFGSIFPFWLIHNPNNFFGGFKEVIGSNEVIVAYTIVALVILIVIWGAIEYFLSRSRKGKKINIDEYIIPEVKGVT